MPLKWSFTQFAIGALLLASRLAGAEPGGSVPSQPSSSVGQVSPAAPAKQPAEQSSPGEPSPGKPSSGEPAPAEPSSAKPSPAEADPIAATVGERAIRVSEIRREMERALRGRELDPAARGYLEAQTLAQLIDRQLVLRYLVEHKLGANDSQLQLALARVEKQLQQQELTLPQYIERSGLTREQFEETLAWQIGWQRYLDRYLTDENMQLYFDQHRQDFDGRRARVSQILLRVEGSDSRAMDEALVRALALRSDVQAGKLTFADAARQHSDAPSGRDGGELGFIERHEPMPEAFSAAAFALKAGEISQPVASPLGVHLILCQEIQPGTQAWTDVRAELLDAVTRYLFQWVASRQRPRARIHFSGAAAYFQPGTDSVVLPSGTDPPGPD